MDARSIVLIAPEDPGTDTIDVPVLKVFDGDGSLTRIKAGEFTGDPKNEAEFEAIVRFGFIDAPELGQAGGHEAKDFLTALIGDQRVELVISCKDGYWSMCGQTWTDCDTFLGYDGYRHRCNSPLSSKRAN